MSDAQGDALLATLADREVYSVGDLELFIRTLREPRCERCGKPENDQHFGLCCACVEYGQKVQDVTEARHQIVIDAARDVTQRVPGAMRRLRAAVALRDGDEGPA